MAGSKTKFKGSKKCETCSLWFRSQNMWKHKPSCKGYDGILAKLVEDPISKLLNSAYKQLQERRDEIVTDIQNLELLKANLSEIESKLNKLGEIIERAKEAV